MGEYQGVNFPALKIRTSMITQRKVSNSSGRVAVRRSFSFVFFSLFFILICRSAATLTFVVDSLGDVDNGNPYTAADGTNTLRKCIRLANDNVGGDTINFGVSGTIYRASWLPAITDDGTIIDASSQWIGIWPAGQPGIALDGSGAGDSADGLRINSADNCHIRGLFITSFGSKGVSIGDGSQFNTVGGTGAGYRNVISGNSGENSDGVWIGDSGTANNVIQGNYIGTDVNGTGALGNTEHGVRIIRAESNTVGGTTAGERNIISGNNGYGVVITNEGADNNTVSGNYIGIDVNGTSTLSNGQYGVEIRYGAQSNTIGGTTEGERNIISGNVEGGVLILSSGSDNNIVSGNYIGTDVNGTTALPNSWSGVEISGGARSNTIGGTTEGERNIISGNGADGVVIVDSAHNVVSGNHIGTDVTGTASLGNTYCGVRIADGAQSNTIGGTAEGERNIISGNSTGVTIDGDTYSSHNNVVSGNYIGTDVTGTVELGNEYGVSIWYGTQSTIGGTTEGERNIISGNDYFGVSISCSDQNVVSGNYICTDVTGTTDLGNGYAGVGITGHAGGPNTIGGTTEGERNIISGNDFCGMMIQSSDQSVVSGNYIGTDVTGTAKLGNGYGVLIRSGAQSNTIGGTTEGERNIISGNDQHGVRIHYSGTNNNIVSGNYIGTDVSGTIDLGNTAAGVEIDEGAQSNIIGGPGSGEGNAIAFNGMEGVNVTGTETDFNRISRNSIHDNDGLGIDLSVHGNDEIPAPAITSSELSGGTLAVSGSGAGASATVEIFEADSAASGEGMTYLGSLTADTGGDFAGQIDVTGKGLSHGDPVVATTTHTDNNTSEFSVPVLVVVDGIICYSFDFGFNIFAIPVILDNCDVDVVLDPIIDKVETLQVQRMVGETPTWMIYAPGIFDEIGCFQTGEGYVITIDDPDGADFCIIIGSALTQTEIEVRAGFNLIAYNYTVERSIDAIFPSDVRQHIETILVLRNNEGGWLVCATNPANRGGDWLFTEFTTIRPGEAIVVNAIDPATIP